VQCWRAAGGGAAQGSCRAQPCFLVGDAESGACARVRGSGNLDGKRALGASALALLKFWLRSPLLIATSSAALLPSRPARPPSARRPYLCRKLEVCESDRDKGGHDDEDDVDNEENGPAGGGGGVGAGVRAEVGVGWGGGRWDGPD
jgi:hypothetical protein